MFLEGRRLTIGQNEIAKVAAKNGDQGRAEGRLPAKRIVRLGRLVGIFTRQRLHNVQNRGCHDRLRQYGRYCTTARSIASSACRLSASRKIEATASTRPLRL